MCRDCCLTALLMVSCSLAEEGTGSQGRKVA